LKKWTSFIQEKDLFSILLFPGILETLFMTLSNCNWKNSPMLVPLATLRSIGVQLFCHSRNLLTEWQPVMLRDLPRGCSFINKLPGTELKQNGLNRWRWFMAYGSKWVKAGF